MASSIFRRRWPSSGDERLIAFGRGAFTRRRVDDAFAEAGVHPRIALEAIDLALVSALVAQGLGMAVLPRSLLERPRDPIALSPLAPPLHLAVVLWWQGGRRLSPSARACVGFALVSRGPAGLTP